jgi:hypothetical protein
MAKLVLKTEWKQRMLAILSLLLKIWELSKREMENSLWSNSMLTLLRKTTTIALLAAKWVN